MSRQRAVRFGSAAKLAGVLTEPSAGTARSDVGVVILDSGILHHVGANRLHVQLARKLADDGFVSLRFDFSGIGDSETRNDSLPFEQSSPRETQDAIDYLVASHGVRKVVLAVLCSGADAAHLTAIRDQRVAGLAMMDPWVYRTLGYRIHHYRRRLLSPSAYVQWIKVRGGQLLRRWRPGGSTNGRDPEMYEMPSYAREFPPRERIAGELRNFVARGIRILVLFSGGLEEYNHAGQYARCFADVDFGDALSELHLPDSTHVFSGLEHQEYVVREVAAWARTHFPPAAVAPVAAAS